MEGLVSLTCTKLIYFKDSISFPIKLKIICKMYAKTINYIFGNEKIINKVNFHEKSSCEIDFSRKKSLNSLIK